MEVKPVIGLLDLTITGNVSVNSIKIAFLFNSYFISLIVYQNSHKIVTKHIDLS